MPDRSRYLAVTLSYWAFTLSDGALRMLVLLHLHAQGQTAWALALMLVPYELAGVVTNLLGGWLGARFGQKPVLLLGLLLQLIACLMLALDTAQLTLLYVMATQVLSGVAKDLTKTAAKSYVRTLAPDAGAGPLFGAVAALTGGKNAIKGLGFFLGGALLQAAGFRATNLALAAVLFAMLLWGLWRLPRTPGRAAASITTLFAHEAAVNWLAAARLFLFGSRDAWFAVALPLFLAVTWGWSPAAVGAFLATWVIGYGIVQAATPRLLRSAELRIGARRTAMTTFALLLPLALAWCGLREGLPDWWLLAGLLLYGAVFAIGSSLHSWLVVALSGAETTAERVGFYYAANAAGRLAGVLLSGWLYSCWSGGAAGLAATIVASAVTVVLAGLVTLPVRPMSSS